MYYIISYMLFYVMNTQFHLKQLSITDFTILIKDGLFWLWIVMSPQLISEFTRMWVQALWRHICRFFLHVQIGTKVIFISE